MYVVELFACTLQILSHWDRQIYGGYCDVRHTLELHAMQLLGIMILEWSINVIL